MERIKLEHHGYGEEREPIHAWLKHIIACRCIDDTYEVTGAVVTFLTQVIALIAFGHVSTEEQGAAYGKDIRSHLAQREIEGGTNDGENECYAFDVFHNLIIKEVKIFVASVHVQSLTGMLLKMLCIDTYLIYADLEVID